MLSERAKSLMPSSTAIVASKAKEMVANGISVIDLSLGDPALDPEYKLPQYIKDSAIDAINNKIISYTVPAGMLDLRKAIVGALKKYNNLSYSASDITVGSGAKQIIFNAFLTTINKGDEAVLPCPAWVSYYDVVKLFGGNCICVENSIEDDFKISPSKLENAITSKTKWLVLNSPSNPTGAIYTKEELRKLADVLLRHPHVMIMSDDIYQHIIFSEDDKFYNIAMVEPKLKDRVLIIDGVAKSHGMTGWRIGYGASSNSLLIGKMNNVNSQSISSACSVAQYAAIAAIMDNRELAKDFSKNIAEKVKLFASKLTSPLVKLNVPKGAFYAFVSIEGVLNKKWKGKVIDSSVVFCNIILEELHIALTPGVAFALEGYFRASLAASEKNILVAGEKINNFLMEIE